MIPGSQRQEVVHLGEETVGRLRRPDEGHACLWPFPVLAPPSFLASLSF